MYAPPEQQVLNAMQKFVAFIQCLEGSPELQQRIRSTENPDQIIEIASSVGFVIPKAILRKFSSDLSADYFPWAGKGFAWRRSFFDDHTHDAQ